MALEPFFNALWVFEHTGARLIIDNKKLAKMGAGRYLNRFVLLAEEYRKPLFRKVAMKVSVKNPGLSELDELCIQTIRFLSVEGVQKAKSGHPGMPMGMAPAAYVLWTKHLRYNPANPRWENRDRFVLSAGHGSMLLYSLLHLTGYDMSLEDLKNFRQIDSKTPGHPEYEPEYGVEVTTGPLGQGISNAVGMAIAQKHLASYFNRDGFSVIDYKVYVIVGDGDLEEGISSEAGSLAGHLGLDNLIVIYDDNHITIDGNTSLAFTEDTAKRYQAYGWHVQEVGGDGNDMAAFEKALAKAKNEKGQPSIIKLRTHIAYGSPSKQDTAEAHGAPLGDDEIRLMKENYGWDPEKSFHVPDEVLKHMRQALERGAQAQAEWDNMFAEYAKVYPELARQFTEAVEGKLPVNLDEIMPKFEAGTSLATRQASGKVLGAVMPKLPLMLGGSADLTPSNNTWFEGAKNFQISRIVYCYLQSKVPSLFVIHFYRICSSLACLRSVMSRLVLRIPLTAPRSSQIGIKTTSYV